MPVRRISPSQIATFQLCERRWYFAKVLGIPEPDTGRAESGKGMHWLLKEWFQKREPPSLRHPPPGEGKVGQTEVGMALASLGALPPPGPHLIVEEHIQVEYGGIVYHGYADLRWFTEAGYAIVHDHKSTSSLQWAKDEAELEWDAQRIFYSYSTGVDTLARWQYVETAPPHDRKLVEVFGTRPQIQAGMSWLHENFGARMLSAYSEPEEARPQNPAACGKFGREGCPYKHRCQIDGKQRIKQIMSMEAIRERMKARQRQMNVSEPAPPPSEPAPPVSTTPEPTFSDENGMMAAAATEPTIKEDPEIRARAEAAEAEFHADREAAAAERAKPDPRSPEQQAPKARKPRSDAGKPRGPRKPKELSHSEDEEMTRGELGLARAAEVTVNVTPEISEELLVLGKPSELTPEQALLQVIAIVRALPQRAQLRVLNAARAFIVEGP